MPAAVSRRSLSLGVVILVFLLIAYAIPAPAKVKPEGWRLFGIFAASVVGLVLQPLPASALVLLAVTASTIVGGLTIQQALTGYADPTVWLVMAAFFISRALINTGLARRIALFFVRLFGKNSLGICYALGISDSVLGTIIPSNGARSGGVILPIVRSIAELYGSKPGATAPLLGSFLMVCVYQSVCVSSAMYFTGQASNPLAAQLAGNFGGYQVTWLSWFVAGIVPGIVSLAVVPLVVYKLFPPQITSTPEAAEFARRELHTMGGMKRNEWILFVVFLLVCGLWVSSGWTKIDVTVSALIGAVALLLMNVITWDEIKKEEAAWDIFMWYGGLLQLGKELNKTGVTTVFAEAVGGWFSFAGWEILFATALLIYFYAHYGFASITAHILAMYPPFLAVLVAKGAPLGLMVYGFACFTNLAAGLTNYGTTPAPMFFAQGYASLRDWWRVGFVVSLVNITIWATVGFAWWKIIGIW